MNEKDQYEYSLLSLNVRSLNKNIDDLRCLVADLKVDFISLCEIFNPLKNYVKIPGYHDLISRNRSNSN